MEIFFFSLPSSSPPRFLAFQWTPFFHAPRGVKFPGNAPHVFLVQFPRILAEGNHKNRQTNNDGDESLYYNFIGPYPVSGPSATKLSPFRPRKMEYLSCLSNVHQRRISHQEVQANYATFIFMTVAGSTGSFPRCKFNQIEGVRPVKQGLNQENMTRTRPWVVIIDNYEEEAMKALAGSFWWVTFLLLSRYSFVHGGSDIKVSNPPRI